MKNDIMTRKRKYSDLEIESFDTNLDYMYHKKPSRKEMVQDIASFISLMVIGYVFYVVLTLVFN